MNTVSELMNMGFHESIAKRMLDSYSARIGEMHGCNEITDITYLDCGDKSVELTCSLCKRKSNTIIKSVTGKWKYIRRTCDCQKKIVNDPMAYKTGVFRNDDPSFIGKVYGDWKVIEFSILQHKGTSGGTVYWICECTNCGAICKLQPSVVRKGKQCKCQTEAKKQEAWKTIKKTEVGKRYGRLTVVDLEHRISGKNKKIYATCNCDCGGHITCQVSALRAGHTKSCGCIEEEFIRKAKDGRSEARTRSPLYGTWSGMIARCTNKNNNSYKHYGGRGIIVCEEWLGKEGFDRFEKWSYEHGYKPESGLSLDRINVNGNYEPLNCRYASTFIQAVNKRPAKRHPAKMYDIDGVLKTKRQWCKEYNISEVSVRYRMKNLGMDFKTALTTPKTRKGNVFAGKQRKERIADLNKCNSYIEANLYLAFIRSIATYEIIPQYRVGKYEADFWIKDTEFLVECDGHDIHKTKEQIAYDYERERSLIKEGYRVIRFTGTEINNDPDRCCREILEVLETQYEHRQTNAG